MKAKIGDTVKFEDTFGITGNHKDPIDAVGKVVAIRAYDKSDVPYTYDVEVDFDDRKQLFVVPSNGIMGILNG